MNGLSQFWNVGMMGFGGDRVPPITHDFITPSLHPFTPPFLHSP